MIETPYSLEEEVFFERTPSIVKDIFISPTTGNIIYEIETEETIPFIAYVEARELTKRNI